ncbi:MAG TPA: hypothetical protein VL147_02560 [Devosia sp.]|nr:hypothetical protein [Devosia sp.]
MRAGRLALGLVVIGAALLPSIVQAQPNDLIEAALRAATRSFTRALPQLDAVSMGVRSAEYGAALRQRQFRSSLSGSMLDVRVEIAGSERGLCAGYAAYVTPAIAQNAMILTICPRFFSPGADGLRETTILHEMVHVVAGPDECRAMAYTAQIQLLSSGGFTPVDAYWARNNCAASAYRLPR